MMSSLASLVVRRRRALITIWAVLLIGTGAFGSSAFSVLSSSFGAGPSTESGRVTERLDDLADTVARSPSSPTASTSTTPPSPHP
jgi:hypothetical protein